MEVKAINAINPNFGAKLRNNEATTNLLNNMDSDDLKSFKSALKKLDKHHKDDVIELRKNEERDSYLLVNAANEDKQIDIGKPLIRTMESWVIKNLKMASEKGSEVYDALFNNKEEEAQKEREQVLSMMV